MKRALILAVVFLSLFGIACSESFLPAWGVTDLRVVAASVEVDGKPGRARPDPADVVQVSLLVIDQGAPPSEVPEIPALTPGLLEWSFVACVPAPTLIGSPICRDLIEPCEGCVGTPPVDEFASPVMRFQVPSQAELDAAQATTVLLQGAVCVDGPPATDAILRFILGEVDQLNPCEDPTNEGRFVSIAIPIEPSPDDPNLNPQIQSVDLNGRTWPPPYEQGVPRTAPRTGCLADLEGLTDEERAAHPVAGSPPSTMNLHVTRDSLQSYMVGDMTLTEELQVSWLTDAGELERTFSFITDPARSVLTQWQPFASVPPEGLLARLTFVIRDGRGGTDSVERGLCMTPPPPGESPP
jgi:hypothetical protein